MLFKGISFMNEKVKKLKRNMEQRIVGKGDVIDKVILTLLSGGHLLLEDVPGSQGSSARRIRCRPTSPDYPFTAPPKGNAKRDR